MQITVERIADEEQGGFTARIPDIPASGEGETEDEAIADARKPYAAQSKPSASPTRFDVSAIPLSAVSIGT